MSEEKKYDTLTGLSPTKQTLLGIGLMMSGERRYFRIWTLSWFILGTVVLIFLYWVRLVFDRFPDANIPKFGITPGVSIQSVLERCQAMGVRVARCNVTSYGNDFFPFGSREVFEERPCILQVYRIERALDDNPNIEYLVIGVFLEDSRVLTVSAKFKKDQPYRTHWFHRQFWDWETYADLTNLDWRCTFKIDRIDSVDRRVPRWMYNPEYWFQEQRERFTICFDDPSERFVTFRFTGMHLPPSPWDRGSAWELR